jgi:type II secretory pathway component PulF
MALFQYEGLNEGGRLMNGRIEAADINQAQLNLAEMKIKLNTISVVKEPVFRTPLSKNEFLLFNQQLMGLTSAGIPLERGLRELAQDAGSKKVKSLVLAIANELESGVPLDQAIQKHANVFPPMYSLILKSGVQSGRLHEMLAILNRHLELERNTRRMVVDAVCYPLMVLCLTAIIITGLFVMVVPAFGEVLYDMSDGKARLAPITQLILTASKHIWDIWAVVGIVVFVVVFIWVVLSQSESGRRCKERFILRIPLLGQVQKGALMARLSQCVSLLVGAGNPLPAAFGLAGLSSGSELIKRDCKTISGRLEQGLNVLESGMGTSIIPQLFCYALQLGSQRNELYESLQNLGQMYAGQVQTSQGRLQAFLMPAMILCLGLIVGFIVTGLFLPMVTTIQTLM